MELHFTVCAEMFGKEYLAAVFGQMSRDHVYGDYSRLVFLITRDVEIGLVAVSAVDLSITDIAQNSCVLDLVGAFYKVVCILVCILFKSVPLSFGVFVIPDSKVPCRGK